MPPAARFALGHAPTAATNPEHPLSDVVRSLTHLLQFGGRPFQAEGFLTVPLSKRHVLYWNASVADREQVHGLLADSSMWQVLDAESWEECEKILRAEAIDAILVDLGPDGLGRLSSFHPNPVPQAAGIPIVLLVDPQSEDAALAALEDGATDYVLKAPSHLRRLPTSLKMAVAATAALGSRRQRPSVPPLSLRADTTVLNALPIGVAILDSQGCVEFVNTAWAGFIKANSQPRLELEPGENFIEAFERLAADQALSSGEAETPALIASALRTILAGASESYSIEFRHLYCGSTRWYRLEAAAIEEGEERGVMISCSEISPRVAAEATVHFQSQLLANIHDAVCATDNEYKITAWNAAAERLYGWRAEEVLGKRLDEIVPCPRSADSWDVLFHNAQGSQPYRNDLVHGTRDGRQVNVAAVSVPLRDARGVTLGYVVTVRDMTDRTLALEAAWENEARWQLAGRAMNEAICDLDLRTGRVWRSEGYHRLFGYQPEELQGGLGWWLKQIHPDDVDRVWRDSEAVFNHDRPFSVEYRFRRSDGSYAYVLHRAFLLKSAQGVPLRITGTLIDITERKRTEKILAQSEKRYRLMAENATDVISRHNADGVFLYISPAVKGMFGYSPGELLGTSVYAYLHPEDLEGARQRIDEGTRQPVTLRFRARHKSGQYVWVESIIRSIQDPANPDAHETVGVTRDVTARKQVEDLLRLQQAELAHISRLTSMGEMASGIAHELNQPLTTISHYADACQQTIGAGNVSVERILTWTSKIAQQAERAGDIIRRIKGFVQKSLPERTKIDLGSLLEEVIELLDPDARLHDIKLQFERVTELPLILVDKVQIQQVLVNLLRNAFESLDACLATNRSVIVRASYSNPHEVLISVEDRGTGISPDGLERLFEPFFTTKPDGTGVGLPISRSIVEDHGGRIWAANNSDQGMTFWFTLPTTIGVRHDGPQTDRLRSRRRSRSSRSVAAHPGDDGF